MLLWLIGTAGCWALLDFCYYGNTISTPEILKLLNPHASLLHNTLVQLGIFVVFAVPGYVVAGVLLENVTRSSYAFVDSVTGGVASLSQPQTAASILQTAIVPAPVVDNDWAPGDTIAAIVAPGWAGGASRARSQPET